MPSSRRRRAPTTRTRTLTPILTGPMALAIALVLSSAGCAQVGDLDELTGAPPDAPEPVAPDPASPEVPVEVPEPPSAVDEPAPGPTAYPDDPSAPACTGTDLDVLITGFDAALGSRYLGLEATNTSGHACAVRGAPTLEFGRLSGTTTPGVVFPALCRGLPPRVVVPADQKLYVALEWNAMSTSLDPDVAVEMRVRPTPDSTQVTLPFDEVPMYDGTTLDQLDVLDGAEVEVGWWQADQNVWLGCPVAP